MISLNSVILVITSTFFGALGGFVFSKSSKKLSLSLNGIIRNKMLILGFFLFGLTAIIYVLGLKGGELNILYPITSLTYIWSTILAKKYLKERINLYKILGITFIVLGSIVLFS